MDGDGERLSVAYVGKLRLAMLGMHTAEEGAAEESSPSRRGSHDAKISGELLMPEAGNKLG